MIIYFATTKLRKICSEHARIVKEWGRVRAKKVQLRLDELNAAEVLEDLRNAPGGLHELKGDRRGQLALDLDGPYRLILMSADNPVPEREDGGLDWDRVRAVTILKVEDYHG
jgi:proteic killer suppression protein